MPSHMSHFERGQDFFSSIHYTSNAGTSVLVSLLSSSISFFLSDYREMSGLPIRSYNDIPDYRTQAVSPDSTTSSPSIGPSNSLAHSLRATSRSPPTRQRTPIRHHRPSTSRSQSSGRQEAHLAYATQQEYQTNSLQKKPSSQGTFALGPSMMPPTTSSYHMQDNYYSSAGMPQQQGGQYVPATPIYNAEPNSSTYYGLGRSVSYPVDTLPAMQPPDSLYQPHLVSTGPSQVWPLSTAGPLLPSMSVPSHPYSASPVASVETAEGIRVLASRPKPQCFDHGCNGRQFSTFSNLLRHQREKSGSASKAVCPHCGTEFTRTTARNGHLYGGKCKGRDGQGGPEPDPEA
jgi:hypothetical protein